MEWDVTAIPRETYEAQMPATYAALRRAGADLLRDRIRIAPGAVLVRAAVSPGAGRRSVIRKVIIPGALPMIFAGFKLGAGTSLLLLVAAEIINAKRGLGAMINSAGDLMQTTKLMVGRVVFSLLGLASAWGLAALERWLLPWKEP